MRTKRPGAAMLETALIALAFIVVVLAAIDVAQFLFFHQVLRDRVQSAVRYAVVHTYDPTVIRNVVLWNTPEPQDRAGLFGLSASMVEVERIGAGTIEDRIEVRIRNFPVRLITPWLSGRTFRPVFRAVQPVESLGATD